MNIYLPEYILKPRQFLVHLPLVYLRYTAKPRNQRFRLEDVFKLTVYTCLRKPGFPLNEWLGYLGTN
jgi:hypothetical protein